MIAWGSDRDKFPQKNKYFAILMGESHATILEAMALIQKLLYDNKISFNCQYYQCDRLRVYPKSYYSY